LEGSQWVAVVTFPGGEPGNRTTSIRTREGYGEVLTPATATHGGARGGGAREQGTGSIWHPGGAAPIPPKPPPRQDACYPGGGGGSSLGRGGDGGQCALDTKNQAGSDGKQCAGGGGAGQGAAWQQGGRGGDGYLRIVPLVDASIMEKQLGELLKRLPDLQRTATPATTSPATAPSK
jgi:hypothetical protein